MIFQQKQLPETSNKAKGIALINVLIISSLLSLLAIGFAFIMVSENKISQSQETAVQTHYLAEAGIQYAIWKLNNDWQDDFESGMLAEEIKLTNELYAGDEIKIQAKSIGTGNAQIESKALYRSAQRKIIVEVYKPLGGITEPLETRALLCGKIYFTMSQLDVVQGSVHSNDTLELRSSSELWVQDTASAGKTIIEDGSSYLYVDPAKRIENTPLISMPGLDFDAYKEKAVIMSEQDLKICLASNECVLNGINYILDDSEEYGPVIENGQRLILNGFLLADDSIAIAIAGKLLINNTAGQPSGLASRKSIAFNALSSIDITGLVYGLSDVIIIAADNFSLSGGIINYKDSLVLNQLNKIDIAYDESIIKTALGQAKDAPIISLNRWEEEY